MKFSADFEKAAVALCTNKFDFLANRMDKFFRAYSSNKDGNTKRERVVPHTDTLLCTFACISFIHNIPSYHILSNSWSDIRYPFSPLSPLSHPLTSHYPPPLLYLVPSPPIGICRILGSLSRWECIEMRKCFDRKEKVDGWTMTYPLNTF